MAGREVEYGIRIEAKDGATQVFVQIGNQAKNNLEGKVPQAAAKSKSALASVSDGLRALHATWRLVEKGFNLAARVFGEATKAALEQRAETDEQRKAWQGMLDDIQRWKAAVGDILIPLVLGIHDAFKQSSKSTRDQLESQRALIGTDLVRWLADVARNINQVGAFVANVLVKAFFGLREIIEVLKIVFGEWYSLVLSGIAKVIEGFEFVAKKLGADGLAAKLGAASKGAQALGDAFEATSDQAQSDLQQLVNQQAKVEKGIDDVAKAVDDGIGRAAVAAIERMNQAIKKVPPNIKELMKQWEEYRKQSIKDIEAGLEAAQRAFDKQIALEDARLERLVRDDELFREIRQKGIDEAQEHLTTIGTTAQDIVGTAISDLQTLFTTLSDSSLEASERVRKGFTNLFAGLINMGGKYLADYLQQQAQIQAASTQTAITTATAEGVKGQSAALAAHAGIPYVGIAIGVAAAAQVLAFILSYIASLDVGGQVQQNGLAFLHKDELVVPKERVKPFAQAISSLAGGPDNGGGGAIQQGLTIEKLEIVSHSVASPVSKADTRYAYHNYVEPILRDLQKLRPVDLLATEG